MDLSRRRFLKATSIGTAAIAGGAGLLPKSAFANQYPSPATSSVAFIGGSASYGGQSTTTGAHKQMIKDIMVPFTANIQAAIAAGKKIILKPNCASTGTNDADGYPLSCTSYYALAGLIEFIQSISPACPIAICEAGASLTTTMFQAANYPALTTAYSNVTLVDLNTNLTFPAGTAAAYPAITRHLWHWDLKTTFAIYAAPIYVDPDAYIISVCRPKTHNQMVITCTTKNCSMGMPLITIPASYVSTRAGGGTVAGSKEAMHDGSAVGIYAGEDKVLAWNVFQNASQHIPAGHPDLAICDAWEGMEGNGPGSGSGVMQYCMIAGTDCLAVDRLAVKLAGLSDTEIVPQPAQPVTPSYADCRYLLWMNNARFGNYNLSNITFHGGFANAGTMATLTGFIRQYAMNPDYTASQAYETAWAGGDTTGPTSVLDSSAVDLPGGTRYKTAVRGGVPSPYLHPQKNLFKEAVIGGDEVKIDFILPGSYDVGLSILDMKGREIRRLGHEFMTGGSYYRVWDCRDDNKKRVPNGTYVIRLQFGSRSLNDPITLLR
jgi:uncharacterized protein (DUF362 family)